MRRATTFPRGKIGTPKVLNDGFSVQGESVGEILMTFALLLHREMDQGFTSELSKQIELSRYLELPTRSSVMPG